MVPVEIVDTLRFLLGEWEVGRVLTDHRLGESGVFRGTATVAPSESGVPQGAQGAQGAQYRESGQLCFARYRGTASRRLRYVRQVDGAVAVNFDDGSRFVDCDLRSGRSDGTHLCRDDRYEISWQVHGPDVVVEEWRVRGPGKDYEARCVLRRMAEPAAARRN
ncbi:MAG: DUF6314 family protein [Acidimicrobiales bacterium]